MLLSFRQMKFLKAIDTDSDIFIFTGQNMASIKEKQKLLETDKFYYKVYGYHIIQNYWDLENSNQK